MPYLDELLRMIQDEDGFEVLDGDKFALTPTGINRY
jgi:hypothetical protein